MGVTVKTYAVFNHSLEASPENNSGLENGENGTEEFNNYAIINLEMGDPTIFEPYWEKMSDRCSITFQGDQSLSYFSDTNNLCWFLEPKLEQEIRRLHNVVGNAVEEDHYIVVGTGSTQLIQAVLYALSPPDANEPVSIVCATPYYSSYLDVADLFRSRCYKWGGDARNFDKDEAYIELVTTPNNPDGVIRGPMVNRPNGSVVYDVAYYWPQYTAITSAANHDVMLFTFSKCTGHAGSRIGWALVRDKEVAKKMTEFIEVSTIGVSKESQLRAAKIMGVVSDSCSNANDDFENFFEFGRNILKERWYKLRKLVKSGDVFSIQKYPFQYCRFNKDMIDTVPGFAWITGMGEEDCTKLLKKHKILARSGTKFGVDDKRFARLSLVSKDEDFNSLLQRLSIIQGTTDPVSKNNI